jgi:hypothetical protein
MSVDFPFYYHIIDNFFDEEKSKKISKEFPDYDSNVWYYYNNPLENKKTCNSWYNFGPETYKTFCFLNSQSFIQHLQKITGINNLYPDPGLHGGGLHIHGTGGKLNIHLDYSIHPKLNLQRKLNLIIYMTEDWNLDWGGSLEFWSHDEEKNLPKRKEVEIKNIFNRAVLFDTTQNSWHGCPQVLQCPSNKYRKSLAIYYMTDCSEDTIDRKRALYAPTKDQENNEEVLNFIKKRVIFNL